MKIKEICNAVFEKHYKIKSESISSDYDPEIVIYIDYEYWRECMNEVNGEVDNYVYEFYNHNTIMGYPVWKVAPIFDRDGEKRHAPYNIVNLDC